MDDDPDDDPEDVDAVFDGVDVLEPLDDSEDVEVDDDPPSFFFVSPEPAPSEAAGVEEPDVVDEVDVLEVVSDEVVDDPPSFLPSPEPAAAGAEAVLAAARESVL